MLRIALELKADAGCVLHLTVKIGKGNLSNSSSECDGLCGEVVSMGATDCHLFLISAVLRIYIGGGIQLVELRSNM